MYDFTICIDTIVEEMSINEDISLQSFALPTAGTSPAYPGIYLTAQPTIPYTPTLYPSLGQLGQLGQLTQLNQFSQLGGYGGLQYTVLPTAVPAAYEIPPELRCLQEMKVNWKTTPSSQTKQVDTSKHFHVFVGDLCPEVSQDQLRLAFSVFGEVSDCKIIKDGITGKPRGYGFVSFINKADAENSIRGMHGTMLGSKAIRTNWATRKPNAPLMGKEGNPYHNVHRQKLDYDETYNKSSATNFTAYVGGIQEGLTEDLMSEHFAEFGEIKEIRVFPEKGYSFVRFGDKESACNAIVSRHGTMIGEYTIKCSWGKESGGGDSSGQSQSSQGGGGGQQYGNGNYNSAGYNQGYYNYGGQGYQMPYYQGYQGGQGYAAGYGAYNNMQGGYGGGQGQYNEYE